MSEYFKNFPTIDYGNLGLATNITARVTIDLSNPLQRQQLLPYTRPAGQRADELAYKYYDNSNYDYLIYFANHVIDPLYDFYMTDNQLHSVIAARYGSVELAQQKIAYWKNNWAEDDSIISSIAFHSLDPTLQQYYDPKIDYNNIVSGYTRRQIDIIKSTNQILLMTLTLPLSPLSQSPGDVVDLLTAVNSPPIGSAQLYQELSSSSSLSLFHTSYNSPQSTTPLFVRFRNTQQIAQIGSIDYISNSITALDAPFYSSVSFYDIESAQNEQRKDIVLISNQSADSVVRQFNNDLLD